MIENFLTATEANALAKSPINLLFKQIKESACCGVNCIEYPVALLDREVVTDIINTLNEGNYSVTEIKDEDRIVALYIVW